MNMLDTYKSILRFASMDTDNEGYVYTIINDAKAPTLLNGKRLVLPLTHHLKNPEDKQIFHPLSENIMRGESEIIEKLKDTINIKLNYTFGVIGQYLLQLCASPELHKNLTPDQTDALIAIKNVDATTVENFTTMMVAGMAKQPSRLFTNIYLKKGGTVRDKRHSRAGIVVFPTYNLLAKNEPKVYDVKIRVKDREAFKQLHQFIFPAIDVAEAYNYGSDSNIAPYLDCLLKTAANIASRYNDILEMYSDYIDDASKLIFDSDWLPVFDNLEVLLPEIRRIPMQAGNEGKDKLTEVEEVQPQPIMQPQYPHPQPQMPQYPHPPVPQYPHPPVPQYPPQPIPQPQYQRPEVKVTKRGLDFQSMKMANPAIVATPNPLQNQLTMQHMQQMMQQGYNPYHPQYPGYGQPQMYPQQMQPNYPYPGQQPYSPMQQPVYPYGYPS